MAFYVGQKVVCVRDDFSDAYKHPALIALPRAGSVYTVRKCVRWLFLSATQFEIEEAAIYLEEIHNLEHDWIGIGFYEHPFFAGRFRPVVERKTDISIFTALLDPANHKQLEGV